MTTLASSVKEQSPTRKKTIEQSGDVDTLTIGDRPALKLRIRLKP